MTVVSFHDSDASCYATPQGAVVRWAKGSRRRFIVYALWDAVRRRPTTIVVGLANFATLALAIKVLHLADGYLVQLYGEEVWRRLSLPRRWAMRRAALLASITEYTAREAVERNGLKRKPVRILSPILADDWLQSGAPCRADAPETESPVVRLLTVARLDADEGRKGIDDVLRVLASPVMDSLTLEYVVVGDGSGRPRLQELSNLLGVDGQVTFMGSITEEAVRAEYANCDIFVMPSTQEGFGIVFLESMASRKPVVAARHGGVPEVVIDGVTGLLVEPADVLALGEALKTLANDPDRRRRMGEAGRRRVEDRYTLTQFRRDLEVILAEVEDNLNGPISGPRPPDRLDSSCAE